MLLLRAPSALQIYTSFDSLRVLESPLNGSHVWVDKDLVNKALSESGNTKMFYKQFVKNLSTNARKYQVKWERDCEIKKLNDLKWEIIYLRASEYIQKAQN